MTKFYTSVEYSVEFQKEVSEREAKDLLNLAMDKIDATINVDWSFKEDTENDHRWFIDLEVVEDSRAESDTTTSMAKQILTEVFGEKGRLEEEMMLKEEKYYDPYDDKIYEDAFIFDD